MIDDDDFFEDDEDDTPRGPVSGGGYLVVPGMAESEAMFMASAVGFRAYRPIIFTGLDEATNETWLANPEDFPADIKTIDQAEKFLSPRTAGALNHAQPSQL